MPRGQTRAPANASTHKSAGEVNDDLLHRIAALEMEIAGLKKNLTVLNGEKLRLEETVTGLDLLYIDCLDRLHIVQGIFEAALDIKGLREKRRDIQAYDNGTPI